MNVVVEPIANLAAHGEVPIRFLVSRVLVASEIDRGLGGVRLTEEPVESPWMKDYDAIRGEGPARWARRFDVSTWGLIAAHDDDGRRLGGAVIAWNSPELTMLRDRTDLAALWDLRVQPDLRSRGVGTALFRAVEAWARDHGCNRLDVETQNINVPACHFCARMGCALACIDRGAYPDLPDEIQLIWTKDLQAF